MKLPPTLQPWAEHLNALDPELAIALGPLVRQLDQLVTRQDLGVGRHGPLDGYDGITRQGSPTRLLMSEWALADAVPDEFLRRAANAELLYLDPIYQQDRESARVAVLVDTGPDQLGAGRLVQLAALIVLARRANARGHELAIGNLSREPGSWQTGDLELQLRDWLRSRTAEDPDPDAVDAWLTADETPDPGTEIWVLAGPRLAKQLPGRRRLLVARECAWDDNGSTAAEVRLGGDRIELALPRQDLAIRALRGAGFRPDPALLKAAGGAAFARFTGSPQRLIARSNDPRELVIVSVEPGQPGKPRRRRLSGQLVAAGAFSKRNVALVLREDVLHAEVFGKPLGHLAQLAIPIDQLGLTIADFDELIRIDLPALYYTSFTSVQYLSGATWESFATGALICRLGANWWRLHSEQPPEVLDLVAVATSRKLDEPRILHRMSGRLSLSTSRFAPPAAAERVIFGQEEDILVRFDDGEWMVMLPPYDRSDKTWQIELPTDGEPFGLLLLDDKPTVLCYDATRGELEICTINRSHGSTSVEVGRVTNWPRILRTPSLHPFAPLLAIEYEGQTNVLNLTDYSQVASLRSDE